MHILIKLFIIFVSIFSAIEVSADKININKEVDLHSLSINYPRCTNTAYRHECYDIARGKGFSFEGYWKQNDLWDGVYTDENSKEIIYKYVNGNKIYVASMCRKNETGWFVCKGGTEYKPLKGGKVKSNGNLEGKFIVRFASGNIYEGNYKNNFRHGHGKMVFESGNVYEGNWLNGKYHGYGKQTLSNGQVYYEGNFNNGAQHGFGKFNYSNGDIYEGNIQNGFRHGFGKYTWSDGQVYEGQFNKNKMVD